MRYPDGFTRTDDPPSEEVSVELRRSLAFSTYIDLTAAQELYQVLNLVSAPGSQARTAVDAEVSSGNGVLVMRAWFAAFSEETNEITSLEACDELLKGLKVGHKDPYLIFSQLNNLLQRKFELMG